MNKRVGLFLGMYILSLVLGTGIGFSGVVYAAAPGDVVINEVAWAGSADSSNDEWIELYNTTGASIDLTGFRIDDDGVTTATLSGTIGPHGYYLIEDSENVVNPNVADLVAGLSLANTGDSLQLFDETSTLIDVVNSTGGAWFAGDSGSKASMERVDATLSGNDSGNFGSSDGSGSLATASLGSLIVGTPGMLNSVSAAGGSTAVVMNLSDSTPTLGDSLTVEVNVSDVADLFSYGMEINYDPAVLSYVSVANGEFLGESGAVTTFFQSGLENGVAGKLIVAEARNVVPLSGVSGSGTVFLIVFDVIGGEGAPSLLSFGADSFLADTIGDLTAAFSGGQVTPLAASVDSVTNLQVIEAAARYTIQLSWDPVVGADTYKVYRVDSGGGWALLDETASALFVDSDSVTNGGNIIPMHDYSYRVVAVKGAVESAPTEANGMETRGLKGDNNRSDRVDGRDLDNLARHYGEAVTDAGFDHLVDTTYDGFIDGSDLIDLGANFALTY